MSDCPVQMLSYGCTRLEIGLQSTYEDVARDTNRGHTVAAVGDCFHLAKDAGFKVLPLASCALRMGFPGLTCGASLRSDCVLFTQLQLAVNGTDSTFLLRINSSSHLSLQLTS